MPGDNESVFGTSMTMQEIEDSIGAEEKPPVNLDDLKAPEVDDIPEAYRGKSMKDIIAIAEGARSQMNESTRAAQEAREAAQRAAELAGRQPPPKVEEPKELTREEMKALYDEDPFKALEIMENQLLNRVNRHVEDRIAPLTDGTMSSAEQWARQEYADEFELFGDKIKGMVDSIPNKQVFSTKKGWEDAVAYVRGQKGNFEKLVEHRADKSNREEGASARERERGNAGFSGRSTVASSSRRDTSSSTRQDADMGDEERQIAQRFINDGTFKDMAEYRKWQRMGG